MRRIVAGGSIFVLIVASAFVVGANHDPEVSHTHDHGAALSDGMRIIADQPPQRKNAAPCSAAASGGRAVVHRAGGTPVKSSALARRAPDACLYRTGFNAAEPTLGIDKKGRIFYQTLDANDWPLFSTDVALSKNDGKTWTAVSPAAGPANRHPYTEDPYLYVDEDTGRVFTADYLLPCSEISFSDDAGQSWTTTVMGCDVVDHQSIFAGPPVSSPTVGYPNIVYYCAADVGLATASANSTCHKSLNGGLTFARTGLSAFVYDPRDGMVATECDGLHGHGVVGRDGTVYLPKGYCGQPWLAISKDEGTTWTRVQVADNGTPTHEAGVAVDKTGNIYYTWIGANRLPYLAVSTDGGERWSKPLMVGPPGLKEASLPGIAVGDVGKVALIYMGSTNSPGPPFESGDYADVTWNGYMTMTVDALERDPVFYTANVNPRNDPLIGGQCGPFRCQAAFDFLDIVIAPDGTPWAAFVDGCLEDGCNLSGRFLRLGEGVAGRLVGGPPLRRRS